ncbi:MAG: ATP-binding cassette domain-containing protein [Chloroflexota bacterium]
MIQTRDLSFRYPDGTRALTDVSLEVGPGEFLALMGANGCGKTTLLKHLIGLLRPSSGQVLLDGKELGSFTERDIFRRVGMVFQNPDDQLFAATVTQDVAFGPANLGLTADEVAARTAEAMELAGIARLADKAIHTLSFGEKRRATIAGVLAMSPAIILLDEVTSGLDPRGVSAIMRLLRQLNRGRQITMIMATHDVELVPLFCDRVAIMSQGGIIARATPEIIFANAALVREARLRLPRLGHLAEILRRDGLALPGHPLTIGQARRALLELVAGTPEKETTRCGYADGEESS